MPNFSIERDLAFLLSDTARLLRTCADQEARRFGVTRAQWGVLDPAAREAMRASLTVMKSNLRQIVQGRTEPEPSERDALERRYG